MKFSHREPQQPENKLVSSNPRDTSHWFLTSFINSDRFSHTLFQSRVEGCERKRKMDPTEKLFRVQLLKVATEGAQWSRLIQNFLSKKLVKLEIIADIAA